MNRHLWEDIAELEQKISIATYAVVLMTVLTVCQIGCLIALAKLPQPVYIVPGAVEPGVVLPDPTPVDDNHS